MKTSTQMCRGGRLGITALMLTLVGLFALPAQAIDFTMSDLDGGTTVGDELGTSSFNTAGNWLDPGLVPAVNPPSAGNNYFTSNFALRTPADGASYTFGGDSLTVNNTTAYPTGLFYKGTGNTGIITIDNLILDGGLISHANGTGDVFQLDGSITVNSASTIYAKQGFIDILADISGTADLDVPTTDDNGNAAQRIVTLYGDNSGYIGNVDVSGKLTLGDTGTMAFDIDGSGTNNGITGTGVTVFDGTFSFDLTGASSTPGDSWTIVGAATQSYGATFNVAGFAQSGDFWTDGTYLFNTTNGTLSVSEAPLAWNVDGGGDWSTDGNWVGGSAPDPGDDVVFGSALTAPNAPATINLDTPVSVSRITFSNTNQYIMDGANTLTLTDLAQLSASSGTHVVNTVIAGTLGLTKTGGGEIILTADNTYTGDTDIQAGILRVQNLGAVDGDVNVEAGASLFFQGDDAGNGFDGTFAGDITGAGEVALSGTLTTETVTFNTAKSYTGPTTLNGGTLVITGAGTLGASDGTAASQTHIATGQLQLDGVAVGNEVLYLDERADAGTAPHLTSSGTSSWAGNVKADIPNTGSYYKLESTSGTLTLSGILSAFDQAAPNDRFYAFDGAGNFNITGSITDAATDADGNPDVVPVSAGNNVHVIKRGAGTLTISTGGTGAPADRDNFWYGMTVIEEGTLAVDDTMTANAGELFSSTIQVMDGAFFDISNFTSTYSLQIIEDPDTIPFNGDEIGQTITGAGTITTGSVTLAAFEDASFTPGDSIGTLTINGNLSISQTVANPNGGLNYEFSDVGTAGGTDNDLIAVSGALTLNADGAAGGPQFNLNVTVTEANLAATSYTLFTAGSTAGSATSADFDITILNPQGTVLNTRQDDGAVVAINANDVTVTFSAAETHNWTGASDGNWDIGTTTNWSSSDNLYFDLDTVSFGDGTGQTTVTIAAPVSPGGITFNNVNDTYTFEGGGIQGAGDMTLNAGANVILANDGSNLTGDVSIAGTATLQQGDGVSTGSTTLSGDVSGDGSISVESGGLVLTGNNTYTTTTTINGGNLDIESATALGTTAAGTEVNAGGSLRAFGQTFTTNEPVTLNGGTIRVGGGGPSAVTFGGNITVGSADATILIDGDTGADGATFTGNVGGAGGNALTANILGGSTATFTGAVSHNGALNKNGGGAMLMADGSSITSPTINVNNGTLDVSAMNGGAGFTIASGQELNNNSNNTVIGDVTAGNGSTISGAGTFANNVTAESGSTIQVGGNGLATAPEFTYLDATDGASGNTALAAGGQFDPVQPGAAAPTVWVVRGLDGGQGTLGNSGSLYQASPDAVDNAPELVTTISGLTPSETYTVYVNYWTATGSNWRAQAGSSQGSLTLFDADYTAVAGATDGTDLNTLNYDVTPLIAEANRTMWGAPVGDLVANGSGEVEVFIDDFFSDENDSRTWYDGVTYSTGQEVTLSETMTITGDLTMNAGANLALDIFDPDTLDLLAVTGNLAAAGTLDVTLDAGAPALQVGDSFNILDFGSASGSFDTLTLPSLSVGPVWDTSQLLVTGILSVIRAPGDADFDGDVDLDDYNILSGNMYTNVAGGYDDGDFDEDGDVDFEDFVVQALNFGDWPSADETIGDLVPEPASMVLMLMGAGLLMRRKTR